MSCKKEVNRVLDFLIKNNIIKKNKLIIDIGMYETKVLETHYEAKRITVISAKTIASKGIVDENSIDFFELASRINEEFSGSGKRDVSVSLPSELCESKIISIKNKKKSEIPKIIKKDYMTFGRVNPITHIVDYAFLGMHEEEGDTVYYYLLSAVQKSVAAELVSSFERHKFKVKTIVSGVYNQICLSEIFFDEYEHLNRVFVDFGTNTTRITAFSEGKAVYTRNIDTGFNSYVKSLFTAQENAGKPEIIRALTNIGEFSALSDDIINDFFDTLNPEVYKRCIAVVTYILSYQQKKRKNIILVNAMSNFFYVLQYVLLGAFEGATLDGLSTVATITAHNKDKGFIAKYIKFIVIIIDLLMLITGLLLYKNIFSLFPVVGAMLQTGAFFLTEERKIRIVSFLGTPFWLIYNIVSKAYFSAVGSTLCIVSIGVAIYRYDIVIKK